MTSTVRNGKSNQSQKTTLPPLDQLKIYSKYSIPRLFTFYVNTIFYLWLWMVKEDEDRCRTNSCIGDIWQSKKEYTGCNNIVGPIKFYCNSLAIILRYLIDIFNVIIDYRLMAIINWIYVHNHSGRTFMKDSIKKYSWAWSLIKNHNEDISFSRII